MKKTTKRVFALIVCLVALFSLASCRETQTDTTENPNNVQSISLWDNAKYNEDMEFGEGEKTLTVKVKAEEKTLTFTVHTDKETVGDALLEHEIIVGEDGPYGLFITHVNGIKAVYEEDGAYWGFFQKGEYMNTGVDMTEISDGAEYELVYTKE